MRRMIEWWRFRRARRQITALRIIIAVAVLAGCDSTKPEHDLTPGQAITLLREMMDLGVWWFSDGTEILPCPLGGEASVTVEPNRSNKGTRQRYDAHTVFVPSGCLISAIGDTPTVNGDPNIVFDWRSRYIGFFQNIEFKLTAAGAVTWERGGDTGSCRIEMVLEDSEVDPDEGTVRGLVTGVLCDRGMVIDYTELD